ncbi:MAG: protein kinase [Planctomycetota bacterium]
MALATSSGSDDPIEVALAEFLARWNAGERPDIDTFCDQYAGLGPGLRRRIGDLVFVLEQLEAPNTPASPGPCATPDASLGGKPFSDLSSRRFEILEEIGRGAFGRVFRARDQVLHRDVALKFIELPPGTTGSRLDAFLGEARALASVSHDNVVTLHDVCEHDGRAFLCMELLQGQTLKDRLKFGPLLLPEAVAIALDVCRGVQAIHRAGLIHRDIKPANIFLGQLERAKVLDFGLGVLASPETTMIAGTPAYMSPEQAAGKALDQRSDIYAIGIVLFEMLTGARFFPKEEGSRTVPFLPPKELPDVRKLRPELSAKLAQVVKRALETDPARRHETTAELEAALRDVPECNPGGGRRLFWVASAVFTAAAIMVVLTLTQTNRVSVDTRFGVNAKEEVPNRFLPELFLATIARGKNTPVSCTDGSTVSYDTQGEWSEPLFLKLRTREDCFLYVVYIEPDYNPWRLLPDPATGFSNPVPAKEQLIPRATDGGTSQRGWAVAPVEGIGRIWVLASRKRIPGLGPTLGKCRDPNKKIYPDLEPIEPGETQPVAVQRIADWISPGNGTRSEGPGFARPVTVDPKGSLLDAEQAFRDLGNDPDCCFWSISFHQVPGEN